MEKDVIRLGLIITMHCTNFHAFNQKCTINDHEFLHHISGLYLNISYLLVFYLLVHIIFP